MRITNNIMINNSLSNINANKLLMDGYNSQLSSTKKIQRASEDPIVAIRALRLRATYADVTQYLEKNIPDARQWLKTTESALDNVEELLTEFVGYCNQGVSDYNTVSQREVLYNQLKQYHDEIYSNGNADYAGRTVFTGYKTDRTLAFEVDEQPEDFRYEIEETFNFTDIETVSRIVGSIDPDNIKETYESDVQNVKVHRIQLAYDQLDEAGTSVGGIEFPAYISVTTKSLADLGDQVYNLNENEVVVVPETGEILLGVNAYNFAKQSGEIKVNYTKTGFEVGDLRPEHYFNCKDISDEYPDNHITYTLDDQKMNYQINFNQSLQVNTLGKDVFTSDMARKIDDIMEAVHTAIQVQNNIDRINEYIETADPLDLVTLDKLNSMKEAAELELSYVEENMSDVFGRSITYFQKYQDTINLAIADIGTKSQRLTLNETRLTAQQTSVEELKSTNEDANMTDVAVLFTAAQNVYDASLSAASKVVQKTLLDFI